MDQTTTVPTCHHCGEPIPLGRAQHQCSAPREKRSALEAWHRPLENGRCEILCRAPGFHMRVSAPEEQVWQAVEMFEQWTGLEVQSERRPRRAKAPPPGQISILEMLTTDELESDNGTH